MKHSSGATISAYSWRGKPSGIRVMISYDNGNTWDIDHIIYETDAGWDLGYPSTIELSGGSLLTVFYARTGEDELAVIMQQKWRIQ